MAKDILNFRKNMSTIDKHYSFLISKVKQNEKIGIVSEWIVDNYPNIVEEKIALLEFLECKNNVKNMEKYSERLNKILSQIFSQFDYKISDKIISTNLSKYQTKLKDPLTFVEISLLKPIMTTIVFAEIAKLCERQKTYFDDIANAKTAIQKINDLNASKIHLLDIVKNEDEFISHPVFLERFYHKLNKLGSAPKNIIVELKEFTESNKINIKQVIKNIQDDKIEQELLIVDLLKIMKSISILDVEDLIADLSLTEKELETDEFYKKLDKKTKQLYRAKLLQMCKKQKMKEIVFARRLSVKSKRERKHIGFYLFKEPNYKRRARIYIGSILFFSIVSSAVLAPYLFGLHWLSFLALLVPISEIFVQIANKLLTKIFKPLPLFKMDYSDGIPSDKKTMVVIPTILKSKEKIESLFIQLEKYYIANMQNNLYFSLLGDCCECRTADFEKDEEIKKFGIKKCTELNKKYGKQLFFFAYRKRQYSKSEMSYLGYERKRGALIHFNKLLLKTFSKDEIDKFFVFENISLIKHKIKYVITLDQDSELIIGAASKLVATMTHPLNKPVLDQSLNKVVSGYGIMQPKISIDVDSSNKSTYVKLFSGIGGFDIYNPVVSNVYQDAFGEGSFMGKGIYDLDVFQKVLENRFPDNLILSHDLLESNYLRSGYISDVELVDDFPSKFLTDMSRHHRWTRGDTQILPWLGTKVRTNDSRKEKNPVSALGKWKIFDNIRRVFLELSLLVVLTLTLLSPNYISLVWLSFVVFVIALPVVFYVFDKVKYQIKKSPNLRIKQYKNILFGFKAVMGRTSVDFIIMPFKACLYANAMFKSFWRMCISKKRLLSWLTAEEAEKTIKNTLINYLKNFKANYFFVLIVVLLVGFLQFENLVFTLPISSLFLIAPFVLFEISKDYVDLKEELKDKEKSELRETAYLVWKYFEDNLNRHNNFMIPDNYQINREYLPDMKTSSTDIGFSIISVISAFRMNFIDKKKTMYFLKNIIETVEKLEKWNGHLYNWYDVYSLKVLYPQFVSSVDSGNMVASLIVLKEFLIEQKENKLALTIEKMINNSDFSVFYTDANVFSLGYNTREGELSVYSYNKFASESRLLSYVAIAKGDVPSKHWFSLDKTLTKFKSRKGLASWAGSIFEYYMPLIFMRSYPTTLLDESYDFAHFCQKEFMDEVDKNLPWGISESAYDELDGGVNYKYKTFSIPYLKLQEEINPRIVISPYSSYLVLPEKPKSVFQNLKKYNNLEMKGKYGLYESYDLTTKSPIFSYFAHHQGMILASIANYLEDGAIQKYFASDINIKAYDILTKEKIQLKPTIDMKIEKYKKFNYSKEVIENDLRCFNHISALPEMSVVSNSRYTVLMNDRGIGLSRFKEVQLNRYRKIMEQDCGTFLYLKDVKSGKFWTNTFAPYNKKPSKYQVVFASDKLKYVLSENDILTTTEIIVTKHHPAEIRKVTIKNLSSKEREIELTTYLEPTITENVNDYTHRTFNSLFISGEYDFETKSLIAKKTLRDNPVRYYFMHKLLVKNPIFEDNQFEMVKDNFLGKTKNLSSPEIMTKELSNTSGTTIDPIMSLRNRVKIPKGEKVTVYILNAFGTSKEQIVQISKFYDNDVKIDKAFAISNVSNIITTKKLKITGKDMRLYSIMLNYLYQTSKISVSRERIELLKNNVLSQENLWKFGISGDRPMIVVTISDISSIGLVKELIKAYEFFKTKCCNIDLIIINDEEYEYEKYINKEVETEIARINAVNDFPKGPGRVYVLEGKKLSREERTLLNCVSRLSFDSENNISLQECIENLSKKNSISEYLNYQYQKNLEHNIPVSEINCFNGFGGFVRDGKEYLITNINTPTPWTNVVANSTFGSLITQNGCGFTYAYNSSEFKITSWSNDITSLDQSEGIIINGEKFLPSVTRHGFGFTEFSSKTKDFSEKLVEFVAESDNAKIYLFTIKNDGQSNRNIKLSYWINPVLGNVEEKTSRYIVTSFNDKNNRIEMRNVYNSSYSNVSVAMSSSEKIHSVSIDKTLTKSITINENLKTGEEKKVVFVLTAGVTDTEISKTIKKYSKVEGAEKELEKVKQSWEQKLSKIQVRTPSNSFNYMLNGWYLYQTLSSRIMARAGFYQVSGAFGYRDQLQDAMNICLVFPDITKKQIISNAKHQFVQGDALHWWLDKKMFGLRSRYKDDFLWLVLATSEYISKTKDESILKEEIPFVEGEKLLDYEHEKGIHYNYSDFQRTLFEHLQLAVDFSLSELGVHGLPKMGGGDWNDGMNKIGINGKGESVWLGFFLYDILGRFIEICKMFDDQIDISTYENARKELANNINLHAWDGKYYLRAFFDNGNKVGASSCDECKIDLLSQSFSILTGIASPDKQIKILEEVRKKLVDEKNKIVKLLNPPFKKSKDYPGYIMDYPEGVRENGGQYTHAVAWYIMALLKAGKCEDAFKVYQMINPINRSLSPKDVSVYKTEPYVIAADIYSNKGNEGRGGWTWYTGSSAWFYRVGLEEILGIKICGNVLEISPKVREWKKFSITLKNDKTIYHIEVVDGEVESTFVNGIQTNKILLENNGKRNKIIATRKIK